MKYLQDYMTERQTQAFEEFGVFFTTIVLNEGTTLQSSLSPEQIHGQIDNADKQSIAKDHNWIIIPILKVNGHPSANKDGQNFRVNIKRILYFY